MKKMKQNETKCSKVVLICVSGNLCKSHMSRAAKSKALSWQEKRDENYAYKYLGRYKVQKNARKI
jgi:hypothetical protein